MSKRARLSYVAAVGEKVVVNGAEHGAQPGYRQQPIAEYDASAALIRQHADLVTLVRRLSRALIKLDPNNPTVGGALRYLERIGETGDVLR